MASVGVVTALAFEARTLAGRPGITVRRCRMGGDGTNEAVRALASSGCEVIVSWGTAGGLVPALRAGRLCLPGRVLTRNGKRITVDPTWRRRFATAYREGEPCAGLLAESSDVLATPADKRRLYQSTGACAVDMESGRVGAACAEAGLPFLAVRCILDEVDDRLPSAAHAYVNAAGATRPVALLAAVLVHPSDWTALGRLARRRRHARGSLRQAARALAQWTS